MSNQVNLLEALAYDAGRESGMLEAAALITAIQLDYQQRAQEVSDPTEQKSLALFAVMYMGLAMMIREKARNQ